MAPGAAFTHNKIRHRRLESRRRRSLAPPPEECAEPVIPIVWKTVVLLLCSNVFMTFAWYAHLRNLHNKAWYIAALVSWNIALFEYLLQVPANRLGYGVLNLAQLKILQEVITLSVFVPFAVFYMHQPVKSDYLWAGVCLLGAVYFFFAHKRSHAALCVHLNAGHSPLALAEL